MNGRASPAQRRLAVAYALGTHRTVAPAVTLERIQPHLAAMGITRAADITGLDRLGIPTWCAIRPLARMVQISNGKGLSHDAAKASALMEAVEHWHCENPGAPFKRASAEQMRASAAPFVPVEAMPNYRAGLYLTDQRILDWVLGENLAEGAPTWIPASAAFRIEPQHLPYSTNGLASGNHAVEATLHALYEVIERDAVTRLSRGGLSLPHGQSRVMNLASLSAGPLADLRDRLARAGVSLVLVRVESVAPVNTFWAVLLDPESPFPCSRINMGHGSHLDGSIAACRAITEAAQSRLTFIHGAREDLSTESYDSTPAHERLWAFFERQRGDLSWAEIADHASGDLAWDLDAVVEGLVTAGFGKIYRVDLTHPAFGIPVVKVLVPGLSYIEGFLAH